IDVLLRGQVLRNDGAAGLRAIPVNAPIPWRTADVNGDGLTDLLAYTVTGSFPNPSTTTVTVWLAGPGFVFTPRPVLSLTGSILGDAAFADLDGDFDLDLLLGVSRNFWFASSGFERVLENDGTGTFTERAAWLPNPIDDVTTAVVAGDFDGDGDVDCAFHGAPFLAVPTWSFRANNGAGVLQPWIGPVVPGVPNGEPTQRVLDLDRDGALDFVHPGAWWRNDGRGNFQERLVQSSPHRRVLFDIGDVDGDGDLDLLFGGYGGNGSSLRLLLDQGGQTFVDATAYAWEPDGGEPIVGDVDRDGDLDVLLGGGSLFVNDGSGAFKAVPFPWQATTAYRSRPAFLDVDGNGNLDVIAFGDTNEMHLYLGNGTGVFVDLAPGIPATPVSGFPGFPTALATFDADGDGDDDVVYGDNNLIRLVRNQGNLTFAEDPTAFPVLNESFAAVACGDFDRDGDIDVMTGRQYGSGQGSPLHMFVNDGTGQFTDTPTWLSVASIFWLPASLSAFDADGDGDLDIAIGSVGSSSLFYRHLLLINDGTGRLIERATFPNVRSNNRMTPGDIDGDGDLDLVAYCEIGLLVWSNNGSGVFSNLGAVNADGSASPVPQPSLQLADFDGDGDADLIALNSYMRNRQWDATASFLPQTGRDYPLQFGALGVTNGGCFPYLGTRQAHIPLPPFGTIGLDLASVVPLPIVPLVAGTAQLTIAIPNSASLVGLPFGVQALLYDGVRWHLSPPVRDLVRN
ncbi:MAG: VCBS repeat-containing protein, partial [Planctomycetota bacterium]